MRKSGKAIVVAIMLSLSAAWSTPAFAAEGGAKDILENAFYGGLTGSLVGAALMAFTSKPGEHLNYIGFGAAAGVMAGAAYGAAKVTKAFAEVENGSVKLAMPTIIPEIREASASKETSVRFTAELVRGRF